MRRYKSLTDTGFTVNTKKLITVMVGAGLAAISATLVSKMFGVESSAAIGGGVGGAIAGVLASRSSSNNK